MILFTPSISLDVSLLDRLANSIDWPLTKVAYNNGKPDALEHFGDTHPDWFIIDSLTENKGVAGSWNECAEMFPKEKGWLLCNDDCWFLPGQLEKICRCAEENPNEPVIFLNSSQAFYCFFWGAAGKETIGLFDDNFFPAYYEDCDYRVRMRLSGKTEYVYALGDDVAPVPHGKPRDGGVNYASMIQGAGLLNRSYWRRKWGSDDHENATYQTPYKDHRLTIRDIVWYPQHRAETWPLWREFINQQNPSIYD